MPARRHRAAIMPKRAGISSESIDQAPQLAGIVGQMTRLIAQVAIIIAIAT
jgi:hypothetical protein